MKLSLSSQLELIDSLIRASRTNEARQALKSIDGKKMPRQKVSQFANLLRRAGLIETGLRVLNPLVRSENKFVKPTSSELIEYAVLLIRHGALKESREIFDSLDPQEHPDALLFRTFSLTPEWRYEEAIAPLKTYISISSADSYQCLIAKVNLIAALIFCRQGDELEDLFADAMASAKRHRSEFLLGSLHELSAQNDIECGAFEFAERSLENAARILRATGTVESLYVDKWRAVLDMARDGGSGRSRLGKLRDRALSLKDWETVRDLDYRDLKYHPSQKGFEYLFSGSPMPVYRERLREDFTNLSMPEAQYRWDLSGQGTPSEQEIYLDHGCFADGKSFLECGQLPHRLLRLLARDFYRPQRLAYLASELFPGEYFNPVSTKVKLHQIVSRLRKTIHNEKIQLQINVHGGAVSLSATGDCVIIKDWRNDNRALTVINSDIDIIERAFGVTTFTTKDCARVLDCSISTATRVLRQACAEGICEGEGRGRKTAFRISSLKSAS